MSPSIAVVGGAHAWPLLRAFPATIRTIADDREDVTGALEFVELEYGRRVLSPVQHALEGGFDGDASVVFDREHMFAYLYIKELRRRGVLPGLPAIHLFDFVADRGAAAAAHNARSLDALADHLARVTGTALSDERLAAAADEEERLSDALRILQFSRIAGRVTGVAAKTLLAGRRARTVAEVVAEVAGMAHADVTGPRVLLVPHESTPSVALHELVEGVGGVVVDEDDWYGGRSVPPAPFAAPLSTPSALAERVLAASGTDHRNPLAERTAWYERRLTSGEVDAAVLVTTPDDQERGWEAPLRARIAERHAVPFLHIHADLRDPAAVDDARGRVTALLRDSSRGEGAE